MAGTTRGALAFFRTASFDESARFVEALRQLVRAGEAPHVDIRSDGVTVVLRALKAEEYGLVRSALELAQALSATANGMGLAADPGALQSLSIIPGAHRSARDHAVLATCAPVRTSAGQPR